MGYCKDCYHWRTFFSDKKAECRRFPPVPLYVDGEIITVFPNPDENDECDEFKNAYDDDW